MLDRFYSGSHGDGGLEGLGFDSMSWLICIGGWLLGVAILSKFFGDPNFVVYHALKYPDATDWNVVRIHVWANLGWALLWVGIWGRFLR